MFVGEARSLPKSGTPEARVFVPGKPFLDSIELIGKAEA
jgi:hypothetical protein